MGLFGTKKQKGRARKPARQEPRLFARSENGRELVRKRRRRPLLRRILALFFVMGFWGVVACTAGFGYIWMTLDKKGLFQIPDREPGMMVLASDGSILAERGAFYGDEVRIAELPAYVPQAIIAIEDRRFRYHYGVDPVGLIRAAVENFRAGHVVQGGSTLTQQLAKNLFLEPDRTIERKAQEFVLAIWLETKFTKDEILQLYMNRVYFGGGAVGIEKAARKYFHKSAREVSLGEAAILAAVLKAPTTYNPLVNPDASQARARQVIADMVESGFIDNDEAQRATTITASAPASDYIPATQYIVDYVSEQLPQLVSSYNQSIVVETTIDPDFQARAEKALRRHLNDEGEKKKASQGAVVMLDPAGGIKALVGGKSYVKSQFNRATKAKRQPGSSFKPFVYLTAIEQGFTPDSIEVDEPVSIGGWEPENYKRKYLGAVTLTKALALSLNTVAAKLAYAVTPRAVAATAHRLGIMSELVDNASLALGTSEVTPLEMTAAFAPFANGGAAVQPYLVSRILTRDGTVLYERHGDGLGTVVTLSDLGAMNSMMRAVVTEGTGQSAQFGNFEIAGKTGTSQDYRDAWFIGYTTYYVTGVWIGNDDNSPTQNVTGGTIPAAVWRDVMEPAHSGLIPMPLPGEQEQAPAVAYDPQADESQTADQQSDGVGFFSALFGESAEAQPPQRVAPTLTQSQKSKARHDQR
ncbi:transglycosylase domain-containing protein [soil metagenome]